MTPGERVVVEAAVRYFQREHESVVHHNNLMDSVEALLAERSAVAVIEYPLTWAQVVAGDEIFNEKVQKWFTVTRTVALINGMIKLNVAMDGRALPKPFERDGKLPVLVRRGETGKAVDVFASVLWSV